LLAVLAEERDDLLRERAGNAILSQPLSAFLAALEGDAPAAALFRYCGERFAETPEIAFALVKHMRCPPQLMPRAAKHLSPLAIQDLMADLDILCARPALASSLLRFASLTADQGEQLRELLELSQKNKPPYADADFEDGSRTNALRCYNACPRCEWSAVRWLEGNRGAPRPDSGSVQSCTAGCAAIAAAFRCEVEAFAAMANLSEVLPLDRPAPRVHRQPYHRAQPLSNPKTPLDISLHFLPMQTQELKMLAVITIFPKLCAPWRFVCKDSKPRRV
jgi:hypothetical protein